MNASTQHLLTGLETWAERSPDAIAVEDERGNRLTYRQLDDLAYCTAVRLRDMGVVHGDRVGICMPKSIHSLICVLGILKARAAYVPVDYSAPAERNRFIFSNCQTRVICTDEPRAKALATGGNAPAPLLIFPGSATDGVGAAWLKDNQAKLNTEPVPADDLAYILYTSGSTGVPKGVMHTQASALSFVTWAIETFQPTETDRFSSHAPFHFDLSILDIYVPLSVGATLVLVGEELGKDPVRLAPFIAEKKLTVWYSAPSILALMAQYGKLDSLDDSALRYVLFAGEVFPVKHLRTLRRLWPGKNFYNLYGPTETNVCTFHRIPDLIDDERTEPFPIGAVCGNCRDRVLDADMQAVPPGGEGILYIHASGPVMSGYWQQPEMNAKVFHVDAQGERWYRTGDVVRREANGDYIFLGRRDRMVKRRGYRIELGEIEAALYRNPQIKEAAVVAKGNDEGVTITACVVGSGAKLSIVAMKQFSATHLPVYMIPDRFVFLEALPRTSTDKVDYQALTRTL